MTRLAPLLALFVCARASAAPLTRYRAGAADFKTFEQGVSGALKVADDVFPDGIDRIDFVLYDSRDLYVYSRSPNYPFKKLRRWGAYQVYRVAHHAHPGEKELARCGGGVNWVAKKISSKLSEQHFSCAPWGAFSKIQKKRESIYQYKNGYLASIIHEYGHQYQDQQPNAVPIAVELAALIKDLPADTLRESAENEAFATWCEMKGSKKLYPDHYKRLFLESHKVGHEDAYGHDAGLRAAVQWFTLHP